MSASPEFYKPAAFPSPCASPLPAGLALGLGADYYSSCRTPTGISYLKEPTTCPPAPRKPLCKKRLFPLQQQQHHQQQQQQQGGETTEVISLRLHELERIFRPHHHPKGDKRRRSARNQAKKTSNSNSPAS